MEKISLYRKYRPKTLKTIIGQELIKEALLNANKQNKISNAYIFSGPRGVGKTSIAKILAAAINCENKSDGDCCLQCNNCLQINANKAIDIVELDAASNNGVEQMRDIIESVNYFPNNLKFKVYIIDEAHMLSNSAWNAMLKTIEEPPAHSIFIFATTEYNKIPLTIVSRCQRFDFNRLNKQEIKQLLVNVIEKENIIIDQKAIDKVVELSDGSGRDSLSILEQLTAHKSISVELINTVFGLSDNKLKIEFIKNILDYEFIKLKKQLDKIYDQGIDLEVFLNELIQFLIDILVYYETQNLDLVKKINENEIKQLNYKKEDLLNLFNELVSLYQKLKKTKYKKVEFDIFVATYTTKNNLKKDNDNSVLVINQIENKKDLVEEQKEIQQESIVNNQPTSAIIESNSDNNKVEEPTISIKDIKWSSELKIIHHKKVEEIKETKLAENKNIVEKQENSFNKVEEDIEDRFKIIDPIKLKERLIQVGFHTTLNKIKEDRERLNNFLDNSLMNSKRNGEIINILKSSKLFASSNNGIILSCDFENHIIRLNQINETKNFVEISKEIFNRPVLVLAVNLRQEKEIKDYIKQNKEQLKKDIIKDVDIEKILKLNQEIEEGNKKTFAALSKLEVEE